MSNGQQGADQKFGTGPLGWAVRDGQAAVVPLPGAAWLMLSALMGLLGLGRKKVAA